MALFPPELVELGVSSYSVLSVLDQAVDLVLNLDGLWTMVDSVANNATQAAEGIFAKLPK
ncbi:MAG: hypothetical protein NTV52_20930 [Acidobacteria bacterium]|nr:hypothetical protein [Acidobacteriota bacterium]